MAVTKRQEKILIMLVKEFIKRAKPISSQLLSEKYNLKIKPATIRLELQKLDKNGYIRQPHTSAGRIPTDKGYRFFVKNLLQKRGFFSKKEIFSADLITESSDNIFHFVQLFVRIMAESCSDLVFSYLFQEDVFYIEGWENFFKKPEFQERFYLTEFIELIENFRKEIRSFESVSGFEIFIGEEIPFSKSREFSIIMSNCFFPGGERGVLAVLGLKRMSYAKNINLISSAVEMLENVKSIKKY